MGERGIRFSEFFPGFMGKSVGTTAFSGTVIAFAHVRVM